MLYRIFAFSKFILTATNQHGVHSPFIYDYVTKCLYKKPEFNGPKTLRVLLESCAYFNAKNVNIVSKNMHIQSLVKKVNPQISFDRFPYDIVYMNGPNDKVLNDALKNGVCHNNSMVLIKNIHKNKESSQTWELMKSNDKTTVSIDMFHCGALFLRQEQAKEHFKIRI